MSLWSSAMVRLTRRKVDLFRFEGRGSRADVRMQPLCDSFMNQIMINDEASWLRNPKMLPNRSRA